MGFEIYYRSTRPVTPEESVTIRQAADKANNGRTWLHCEPLNFFPDDESGHMWGGSKPNLIPHPDDAASAARENLPDGTTEDMVDVLCQLSKEHKIDWALSCDSTPMGQLGYIRSGACDEETLAVISTFKDVGDILAEMDLEDFG